MTTREEARAHEVGELLTPAGVAALLFVDRKTVSRWALTGKIDFIRTPGGHRRFLLSDVLAIKSGTHVQPGGSQVPSPRQVGVADSDARARADARAAAAERAADAAVRARGARAFAADEAAQAVAHEADRTARRVRIRADVAAAQVSRAAAQARDDAVAALGGGTEPAELAALVAATVESAARMTALDTRRAADVVATAVASAAARVARVTAAAEDAYAHEVVRAAEELTSLACRTPGRVASET